MLHPISSSTIIELANKFNNQTQKTSTSDYWNKFLKTGTTLWLDTGDIDASDQLWNNAFSALTTNNTLLNKEVQKGLYDNIIPELSRKLHYMGKEEKTKEIAFCLNAIHGLRITRIFNCMVSVELHTDLAHDIEGIAAIGKRLHDISPRHFLIKVPLTPAGLLGARKLHHLGVPVNFTLDFSVRQNTFAAILAQPVYTNVFLGRIGAYMKNNQLGEGLYIGEKVTLESQHCLRNLNKKGLSNTKLIAASIRNKEQLLHLLGTDIFTIPIGVANDALSSKMDIDHAHLEEIPEPELFNNIDPKPLRLKHLWQTKDYEKEIILHFNEKTPANTDELIEYTHQHGCHDLFPQLTAEEHGWLKADGKIPKHERWAQKIKDGDIGIDSLLNLAGLYSFEKDQSELDKRIESLL